MEVTELQAEREVHQYLIESHELFQFLSAYAGLVQDGSIVHAQGVDRIRLPDS